jgi:predicted nuclease with TOPRIM domain
MRKNVKDATVEAETLNLLNANRTLKQQLEQVQNAREATLKDSALTRKQVNNLEANMAERLQKLKKEQEVWTADADELKRLRAEMKQYRDLLSAAESRELEQTHRLEIMKRDMESWEKLNNDLQAAHRKARELEHKEFEFETAKREIELLNSEKQNLQMRLRRHEEERDRMRKIHADRVAELEAQVYSSQNGRRGSTFPGTDGQAAIAEANNKLAQLKKAHSRLLDKYTDLELEYSSIKSQLHELQGIDTASIYPSVSRRNSIAVDSTMSGALLDKFPGKAPIGILESVYDISSDDNAGPDALAKYTSTSDPTSRRGPHHHGPGPTNPGPSTSTTATTTTNLLPSPPRSETTATGTTPAVASGGFSWKPSLTPHRHERIDSTNSSSRDSTGGSSPFGGFNQTKPLTADERSVNDHEHRNSDNRKSTAPPVPKIKPQSEVRVYGRGKQYLLLHIMLHLELPFLSF